MKNTLILLVFSAWLYSVNAQTVVEVNNNIVTVSSDSSIGVVGDILQVLRPTEQDTFIIGYIELKTVEDSISTGVIYREKESYEIQPGDLIGKKKSNTVAYFSLGLLNGGALNTQLSYSGITLPFELHYPDNAEIINFGASRPIIKSGSLHGYFNFGIPLRKIRLSTDITGKKVTENTDVVSVFLDGGLMLYPMKSWKPESKFQPFVQGGIGLYIIADGWSTLVVALFSSSSDTYDPETNDILSKRMDLDIQFSIGGGMDYTISDDFGLRLSVKKQRFNMPDMSGAISPLEISLGVIVGSE